MKLNYIFITLILAFFLNQRSLAQLVLVGTASTSGGTGNGTVFKYSITDSAFSAINSLALSEGTFPAGSVLKASNGRFYFATNNDGSLGFGQVNQYASDMTLLTSNLIDPVGHGKYPGNLMQASDGFIYIPFDQGGANDKGTICKFDINGTLFTNVHDFDGLNGSNPIGGLTEVSGFLYGITSLGGNDNAGVVYKYDITNSTFSVVEHLDSIVGVNAYSSFTLASNGLLYATCQLGGANGLGSVIACDPVLDTAYVVNSFVNTPSMPIQPYGALAQDPNNSSLLIGTSTNDGSSGFGCIYSFNITNNAVNVIYNFTFPTGITPKGELAYSTETGKFYGVTSAGGSFSGGSIFDFDPITTQVRKLVDLNPSSGTAPHLVKLQVYKELNITAILNRNACFQASDGEATVNLIGGTPPYTFNWNPFGQSTQTATNLTPGTYTVAVYESGNTMKTATVQVTENPEIVVTTASLTDATCFGSNNGTVSLSVSGGAGGFIYNWAPSISTTANATNLSTGSYTYTVTDVAGCIANGNVFINEPPQMQFNFNVLQEPGCHNEPTGELDIQLSSGGVAPFSFLWNTGAVTQTINGLVEGLYTCTVTDANGCTDSPQYNLSRFTGYELEGTVLSPDGPVQAGSLLVLDLQDTLYMGPLTSGALGSFSFPNAPGGNFRFKILLDTILHPTIVPTYYGDAFQWDSSLVLNRDCANHDSIHINMIELLSTTGTGIVTGYVLEGNNFGGNREFYNGTGPLIPFTPGGPLKGIDVKLGKNPGGGIQARTTTDTSGFFNFENIPDGNYSIYVDIPGYPMDSTRMVTLAPGNNVSVQNNYAVDSIQIYVDSVSTVSLQTTTITKKEVTLYPNPAADFILLDSDDSFVIDGRIEIRNAIGQLQISYTTESFNERISLKNFSEGLYFISLITKDSRESKKLIIKR